MRASFYEGQVLMIKVDGAFGLLFISKVGVIGALASYQTTDVKSIVFFVVVRWVQTTGAEA